MNVLIQGAGRGIGLGLARRAIAAGAERLILTARDPLASEGFSELGQNPTITWVSLDVTSPDSVAAAGQEIRGIIPRLDRAIFTAGMLRRDTIRPEKRIADIDPDALMTLYATNAFGPILMARELWPLMKGDHPLRYAAISARVGSISDNRLGGWYSYRASKAALNQLMRTLSIELGRTNPNATVLTLHPGTVDTDLSKPFQGNVPDGKLFAVDYSAGCLWDVVDQATPVQSGSLIAYDGSIIPY